MLSRGATWHLLELVRGKARGVGCIVPCPPPLKSAYGVMVADGELVRQQRRETCDDWKIDGTDRGTEREKGRDGVEQRVQRDTDTDRRTDRSDEIRFFCRAVMSRCFDFTVQDDDNNQSLITRSHGSARVL